MFQNLIQLLRWCSCNTNCVFKNIANFQEYCRNELHSLLLIHKINKVKRADIVFDIYKDHSIKSTAREIGFGRRVKVSSETPIPKNCGNFLRVNENKAELFELSSNYVTCIECANIIVATKNEKATTNDTSTDLSDV